MAKRGRKAKCRCGRCKTQFFGLCPRFNNQPAVSMFEYAVTEALLKDKDGSKTQDLKKAMEDYSIASPSEMDLINARRTK